MERFQTITPVDGSVYVERPFATASEINTALESAAKAYPLWKNTSLEVRQALCRKAVECFVDKAEDIAEEITWMMGRPISYTKGEVAGFEERALYMIDIAPEALSPMPLPDKAGFRRYIKRVPLGTVFVVAPWNYPYLTAVNAIVPALLAGNTVLLKHSAQTPLCAERMSEAFAEAGLPKGVFQYLHLSHADTESVMQHDTIRHVAFTGSVPGGRVVEKAIAGRFISAGLELGGKDPAYIRHDANVPNAVDTVIDGAFFNSGQSCCGMERLYVHESVFDDVVDAAIKLVNQYQLGRPDEASTTLGPLVRTASADFVRGQTEEAILQGAKPLIDASNFPANQVSSPYLTPQLLVNVDHSMRVMTEETFGPVLGIQRISSDEEALRLMNESEFGLTAAIFTEDEARGEQLADNVESGTVFLNRCDYLDPGLAWVGVKNSGRGCTLSKIGFEHLTRPKSYHFKRV
ncbi:Succinate semialdehyde dehydrogenase [NAD(P)+] Sad [Grimontia celer]|uniref:Succinate semialdehyde dehydrogenase [NAD(P)+] Sad n=1 Tax=Grimontia celer TaxID=1796497 RepID=A0A128EY51_9GAMM|nr:aldehyde dehydrogenase family protein [Grimontia celer]CZF79155.1 Succinate semialdehyde dehydrogenase [NAD(P)+] Sad [Grimontia celer]